MRVLVVQHQDSCPPGLIGERLVERGAELEVVSARSPRLPDPAGFQLVVPLGSYDSTVDETVPYLRRGWELVERAVAGGVPVFGICFGAQLLCRVLGGRVFPLPGGPEVGWMRVQAPESGVVGPGPWLVWHIDALEPGPDSTVVARTPRAVQAFVHGPHVGVQFHPEAMLGDIAVWAAHYRTSLEELGSAPTRWSNGRAGAPRRPAAGRTSSPTGCSPGSVSRSSRPIPGTAATVRRARPRTWSMRRLLVAHDRFAAPPTRGVRDARIPCASRKGCVAPWRPGWRRVWVAAGLGGGE